MISKKFILILSLFMLALSLCAIPENALVTFPMPYPMKATQDGAIVVGQAGQDAGALVWTEALGVQNFGEGNAYDISDNLIIAGEKRVENNGQIYLQAGYFNMDGQFTSIGSLPDGAVVDGFGSTAYAISGNGQMMAGMCWKADWTTEAFKWTNATGMTGIYPATTSRVNSLNQDGSIAGGWITHEFGNRIPVYWDLNNNINYVINAEENGEVMGVSPNGQYICGYYSGGAFVKSQDQLYSIASDEPMTMVLANYVNNNGMAVGLTRNFNTFSQDGFVYTPTLGMVNAHTYFQSQGVVIPEGVTIVGVSWVSNDNRTFIGFCYTPTSAEGFIIKLASPGQVNGQITLNGGNGQLTQVLVSNGVVSTHPDTNGNYTLNVAPGNHTITASLNGYNPASSGQITVLTGQPVNNVNLTLNPISNAASVSGTINIANGMGNISAVLINAGNYSCNPNTNGQYTLYLPAGTYSLNVSLTGYYNNTENITLTANQNIVRNFDLYTLGTPSYIDLTINHDYDYPLTNAQFGIAEEMGYTFKNIESPHLFDFASVGTFDVSLILPGYQSVFLNDVVFSPNDTTFIVIDPIKIFPSPKNVTCSVNGLVNWEVPVPLSSFYEDYDNYAINSSIYQQNPMWKAYDGVFAGANDAMISDDFAFDGFNSLKFTETSDVLVDLHNMWFYPVLTSGAYGIEFNIFVPEGKGAHYNLLRNLWPFEFTFEAFFKEDGTLKYFLEGEAQNRTFAHNTWINIKHEIDIDLNEAKFYINNELIETWQYDKNAYDTEVGTRSLSVIDFSGECEPGSSDIGTFYIDNFAFYNQTAPRAEAYKLYFDNTVIANNVETLSYQMSGVSSGNHVLGVSALYGENESLPANINVNITSNDNPSVSIYKDDLNNYPNPFNPKTNISFQVAKEAVVMVEIYNVKGQKVKELLNQKTAPGRYNLEWNGTNQENASVGSGVYFIRLKTDQSDLKKKVLLLK